MVATNNHQNISYAVEKTASELNVGDKIIQNGQVYNIFKITDKLWTRNIPNLYMKGDDGIIEHDTVFDEPGTKYLCY